MSLTKAALIAFISEQAGLTKVQATDALNMTMIAIHNALSDGEDVVLPGIGKLKPVTRAARVGRNPFTGKTLDIPERTAIKFVIAKELKDAL